MKKKLSLVIVTLTVAGSLAGCASIPTEYTSPCACLYEPIHHTPIENEKLGKTVT